ncbi:MAG: hypothetical protein AAFZ91_00430 [Pseudomonadota bacterium]
MSAIFEAWGPATLTAVSGFLFSFLACIWVMRLGVVDAPDEDRKTQETPVPRLGGVGILIGAIFGMAVSFVVLVWIRGGEPASVLPEWTSTTRETARLVFNSVFFTVLVFAIGLWDDVKAISTKTKLAIFTVVAVLAGGDIAPTLILTPFGALTFGILLSAGSALWLLVFTNAANFMDGSNGLSIGCLAIMLAGLALIGSSHSAFDLSVGWFALFGAIGGFLVHNLRGNLYAGDAGALGLGALFASLGLASGLEVWTVATLALPFLVDVLLTLVWRAKHGRSWLSAHRDHAYQRLMDQGWGHLDVAIFYWGLSAVCVVAAMIAVEAGGWVPFSLFWVLLVAGCVLWCVNRSTTLHDQSA